MADEPTPGHESTSSATLLSRGMQSIRRSVAGVFAVSGGVPAPGTAPPPPTDINRVGLNNMQKNFLTTVRDQFKAYRTRALLLRSSPDVPRDDIRAFIAEVRAALADRQPEYEALIAQLRTAKKDAAVQFAARTWTESIQPVADLLGEAAMARARADDNAAFASVSGSSPRSNSRLQSTLPRPAVNPIEPNIIVVPPPHESTPEHVVVTDEADEAIEIVHEQVSSIHSHARDPPPGEHATPNDGRNQQPPPTAPPELVPPALVPVVLPGAAEAATITKDDLIQRQLHLIKDLERQLSETKNMPHKTHTRHPPPNTQAHYNKYHYHKDDSPRSRLHRPPSPGRRRHPQQQEDHAAAATDDDGAWRERQEDRRWQGNRRWHNHSMNKNSNHHDRHSHKQHAPRPLFSHNVPQPDTGNATTTTQQAPTPSTTASSALQQPTGPSSHSHQATRGPLPHNPILRQYHYRLPPQTQASLPNPYSNTQTDENAAWYLALTPPWNIAPPPDATKFSDYEKLRKLAPRFDGRDEAYILWRQSAIPAVHLTNASAGWKALALMSAFSPNSRRLQDIAEGVEATARGYKRLIRNLERVYGHPLGILGARQAALDRVATVRRGDMAQMERLYLKLESLIGEFENLGREQDIYGPHLFENVIRKLDHSLLRDFHLWNGAVAQHSIPNAITVLAWLDEALNASKTVARLHRVVPHSHRPTHSFTSHSPTLQEDDDSHTGGALQPSFLADTPKFICPFDGEEHRIIKCPKFQEASPTARRDLLLKHKRCFSCFEDGHMNPDCTRNIRCKECSERHHTLLHGARPPQRRQQHRVHTTQVLTDSESDAEEPPEAAAFHAGTSSKVALQTLPVLCINPISGTRVRLNCMLDSGATGSFLSQRAAAELGLQGRSSMATIKGFNGASVQEEILVSHLLLRTPDADHEISVQVVRDPAASYQPFDWTTIQDNHDHLRNLPLAPPVQNRPVDLMLGQATPHLICALQPDIPPLDKIGPTARKTRLGWTVGGPTGTNALTPHGVDAFYVLKCAQPLLPNMVSASRWSSFHFAQKQPSINTTTNEQNQTPPLVHPDKPLFDLVQRMFDVDDAAGPLANSMRDEQVFAFLRQHIQLVDGRYQLPVLWKTRPPPLKNNYPYALKRLQSLEKSKLFSDTALKKQYLGQIQEWLQRKFVEQCPTNSPDTDDAYYLPHFGVLNPHKLSSQLRTVMDAAAKPHGKSSLNDHVHKGPKLVTELVTVLLRFRRHAVAVGADIEKMFHKLTMPQEDRDYHRFLWRTNPSEPPKVYRWRSHVFGNAGSPCVAIFATKEHARRHRASFPSAADTIIHSTLVDDSLDSRPTVQQAAQLLHQLQSLLHPIDMQLKKVVSSHPAALQEVSPDSISPGMNLATFCNKDAPLPTLKTLGVIYRAEVDKFTFHLDQPDSSTQWTKRKILQFEARLYDPHGLVLPYILSARMILQCLWRHKTDWDEPIPLTIAQKWQEWLQALPALKEFNLPRCVHDTSFNPTSLAIHIFCDASSEAYAAVAYAVSTYEDAPTTSRLLLSKGKVAPIRQVSIPRLELMAAELAVDLAFAVVAAFAVPMNEVQFWSDSSNVLCWLHNDTRVLTSFVGTRTAKIQRATSVSNWRHVPSELNPADIPSRGLLAPFLNTSQLWRHGPPFLTTADWPDQPDSVKATASALEEVKKGAQFSFLTAPTPQHSEPHKDGYQPLNDNWPLQHFSSWTKNVRVLAWCLRWRYQVRRSQLQPPEIAEASRRLIKYMQRSSFQKTCQELLTQQTASASSALFKLHPFLGLDGLVRLSTRIRLSPHLPYNTRCPIVIPKDHPLTLPLIRNYHALALHGGQNHIINLLLRKFWVVNARSLVRRVATDCIPCRRRRPLPIQPPMAPLPKARLGPGQDNTPFAHVGIDMAGPFSIKNSHLEAHRKRYFLLFTCLATRAVHLEPLLAATTASFLFAFERFMTRRRADATLQAVYADNGSNIRGAQPELQALLAPPLASQFAQRFQSTKWNFNPPHASHFGGVYERLIGAVKRALHHALPVDHPTTDEEFSTTLVVVEGILNSRPLSYVTGDQDDPLPLTPADALGLPPYRMVASEPAGGWGKKKAWHAHQRRLDTFWSRFQKEIVPHLQTTSKWHKPGLLPKVGDIVALLDDQCRGRWPLARITQVYPAKDGFIRRVQVQTPGGKPFERAVHLLGRLLPTQDQ